MEPVQKIKDIQVSKLKLWSENPRDPFEEITTDYDIISRAVADSKKWNLQKLINEMGEYYDFSELPTVVEIEGVYTVSEQYLSICKTKSFISNWGRIVF